MMLIHRSIIRQDLYKSPILCQPSRNTSTITGSSLGHPDLLKAAKQVRFKGASTVQVGTSYENLCARTLTRLDFFDLTRTGGRADRGIDLLGKWLPPSLRRNGSPPFNVVVQCKAVARKAGPEMIRELEGALAGAPGEWKREDTIGVLCAKKDVTAGVRDALTRSKRGFVWVMIEDVDYAKEDKAEAWNGNVDIKESPDARGGKIRQVHWNARVQKLVGDETGIGVVHLPGQDGGSMETEVLMSKDGVVSGSDC